MELKHTPGPWVIGPSSTLLRKIWTVDGDKITRQNWICETHTHEPQDEANMLLIAAAPDLYEALLETLDIARRNEGGEYVKRAVAALAKARGYKPE